MNKRLVGHMTVPADSAAACADAVEPFADSLNIFEADPDGRTWRIEAIFAHDFDRASLKTLLSLVAAAHGIDEPVLDLQPLADTDWLARVQAGFPPLRVGRIFLHGSHYTPLPGDGPIRLRVDAGLAFGSGEHPTTRGCLLALQDLQRRKIKRRHCEARSASALHSAGVDCRADARNDRKCRILDMGCGSGILSLAAARLWRGDVVSVDIDAEAVRVTRDNARLNGVARHVRAGAGNGYAAPVMARQAEFDVIVSNILARPLRRMAPVLARSLRPGGHAVLSGLLRRQSAAVIAAHRAQGLRLVRRYPIGDWQTLVMTK